MFVKYMHLERYGNEEVDGIEQGTTYVFPKLDGTNAQLWLNKNGTIGAVSQFKGVSRKRDKWRARIVVNGVEHNLGVFETEIAAGLAYKQASRLLQGEYSID